MENTPNLAMPYIAPAQAQKHVTHNDAIRLLDAVVQIAVVARAFASPPQAVGDGQRFIVAAGAAKEWQGHENAIAARLFLAELPDRLKKWLALDVAHRAADFTEHELHLIIADLDEFLDLGGDMGDDLDGFA